MVNVHIMYYSYYRKHQTDRDEWNVVCVEQLL